MVQSLRRAGDDNPQWQRGIQGKECLPPSHTFECSKSEMTLWLEHRWVTAEVWAHTCSSSLSSGSGSLVAQCPLSDVRVTLNQCVSSILVTQSHTIPYQPVGAIQLPGCPPRPGPSQESSEDPIGTNLGVSQDNRSTLQVEQRLRECPHSERNQGLGSTHVPV